MNHLKIINIVLVLTILFLSGCNKTSNKISKYIRNNCNFEDTITFFNAFDNTYYKASGDLIDLKKALDIDYDTLYLISVGFESDISDIIGFKYNGGDFTLESEDKNLLLLVKNNEVVYQDKIKSLLDKVNFVYPFGEGSSACLLKHSSSIYKVKREKDGLIYRYYLYNVNSSDIENVKTTEFDLQKTN